MQDAPNVHNAVPGPATPLRVASEGVALNNRTSSVERYLVRYFLTQVTPIPS